MNILVTGSNGQLGNEFRILAKSNSNKFFFTDVEDLDITDSSSIKQYVEDNEIECVINCAAYTAVDKAEEEKEMAWKVNAVACENLAKACADRKFLLIHISTDYVFNGRNHIPYKEDDPTNPVSVYGESKLEGERMILKYSCNSIIIRTSWLYSSFGNNFVKTILRLSGDREEIGVIFDQVGSPTYARDLADAVLKVIDNNNNFTGSKLYHYSNEGVCSWYDFAREIVEISGNKCFVKPIETKDYPLPAPRPSYSVFNKSLIKSEEGVSIPHWKESLSDCIKLILK